MFQIHLTSSGLHSTSNLAFSLFQKSAFGEKKSGKIIYLPSEALYLLEKGQIEILQNNKGQSFDKVFVKLKKKDKNLDIKYLTYKELRKKGYIPKTGLKFGSDFRLYDKGTRPGSAHAPWLLYILPESQKISPQEFAAKARVAHSTKKKLLLAIVDSEESITYYETGWKKF